MHGDRQKEAHDKSAAAATTAAAAATSQQKTGALPYNSFDDAVLAGDFVTADAYYQHENRTLAWLDSMIAGRKQTVANQAAATPGDNKFNNNPENAAYASKLVTAYEAYKAHLG